jgi:hypothetical protein
MSGADAEVGYCKSEVEEPSCARTQSVSFLSPFIRSTDIFSNRQNDFKFRARRDISYADIRSINAQRWRKNKTTIVITYDLSLIDLKDFCTCPHEQVSLVEQGFRYDLEAETEYGHDSEGGWGV